MGTIGVRRFNFATGRLVAVVVGLGALGMALVVMNPTGDTKLHALSASLPGSVFLDALAAVLIAASLFHLPNLIRSLRGLPAIVISDGKLMIHQYPSRVIPLHDISHVEWSAGSLRIILRSGSQKWINLKIVQDGRACADAVEGSVEASV